MKTAGMIVKTRHFQARTAAETSLPRGGFAQGCGVLRHSPPPGGYRHVRHQPPAALAAWVQHFWVECWDWPEQEPQTREVLPHPCVHLVFASGRSRILGVQRARFVRQLKGRDRILGVKFRPGAFYPFLRRPVASLADSSLPLAELFDAAAAAAAEQEVLAGADEQAMVEAAGCFLAPRLPPPDPWVEAAAGAVEEIACDSRITRVEHLTARSGLPERSLQRLFSRYVGASPRWVIKRYRIYEVLEHLGSSAADMDWAGLAQELGYFDQAHFIKDFKKLVGRTPAEYRAPWE